MSQVTLTAAKHDVPDVKPKHKPKHNPKQRQGSFVRKPQSLPLPDEPFSKASIEKDIALFSSHGGQFRACGYAAVVRGGKIYFSYRAYAN